MTDLGMTKTRENSGGGSRTKSTTVVSNGSGIREVWASNLEEEFRLIRSVVQRYPYVAMDTEFPGIVARPLGEFKSREDYQYQLLRCNVDVLKLIQVGLTFMNDKGELPPDYSTWQFNFRFNIQEDMFAQDSYDLLAKSGIQFRLMEEDGIKVADFAELLMSSGLVLCDNVTWLSFHSGYDFGYLIKILTNKKLSDDQVEFFELLKLFFPRIYDIKTVLKHAIPPGLHFGGGLQEISDHLQVERIGPQHQAGSDSLLTGLTFFKIKEKFFDDSWTNFTAFEGMLYGLGNVAPETSTASAISSAAFQNGTSSISYDQNSSSTPSLGGLIQNPIGKSTPPRNSENMSSERKSGSHTPPQQTGSQERESSTSTSSDSSMDSSSGTENPNPVGSGINQGQEGSSQPDVGGSGSLTSSQ